MSMATRITRLEDARAPKSYRQYVYRVSDPPTPEEEEAIANARGPIIIVPHACKTVEEWVAKHPPREAFQ